MNVDTTVLARVAPRSAAEALASGRRWLYVLIHITRFLVILVCAPVLMNSGSERRAHTRFSGIFLKNKHVDFS